MQKISCNFTQIIYLLHQIFIKILLIKIFLVQNNIQAAHFCNFLNMYQLHNFYLALTNHKAFHIHLQEYL